VQEATTNALRRAEAKHLEIRLDRRKDELIVMIPDWVTFGLFVVSQAFDPWPVFKNYPSTNPGSTWVA